MKLYLLRHGHSPSLSEAGVAADALRPLSEAGRDAVKRMARELARRGGAPSLILHSPLLRAVESAGLARLIIEPAQGTEMFPPLKNELSAAELLESLIRRCQGTQEVLAVGHQPQLGELAAHLTGTLRELRPGSLIAIDLSEARFLWSCSPDELAQE
jgi:phosphohistidine phosphatase